MREHRARFNMNFQKAANNITEPGETEVIKTIGRERNAYYRMYDDFLKRVNATEKNAPVNSATRSEETAERSEYFKRLEPQFHKLRAECDHLLQLDQRAMLAKSEAAGGLRAAGSISPF